MFSGLKNTYIVNPLENANTKFAFQHNLVIASSGSYEIASNVVSSNWLASASVNPGTDLDPQDIAVSGIFFQLSGYGDFLVNITSTSTGFLAGASVLSGGPFDHTTILVPGSGVAEGFWMRPGDPGSSGTIGIIHLPTNSVTKYYFKSKAPEFTVRKPHSYEVFNYVSSFFDLFEDRDLLARYWNCWQLMASDAEEIVHDTDIDDNIYEMNPYHTRRNMVFSIDPRSVVIHYDTEYPYEWDPDMKLYSVPSMLTMAIRSDYEEIEEVTDYIVSGGNIFFKKIPARSGEFLSYFCPVVYVDGERPWANFGSLLDIQDKTSTDYLTALRALWYAYLSGPSLSNVANALSVVCGIPVNTTKCSVLSVTATRIELSDGTGVDIPSGALALVRKGAYLEPYTALIDGVSISDRTVSEPGGSSVERVVDYAYPFQADLRISVYGENRVTNLTLASASSVTSTTSGSIPASAYSFDSTWGVITLVSPGLSAGSSVTASYDYGPKAYLDSISVNSLTSLFGAPINYEEIKTAYGEEIADKFVRSLLQWHVHVIDIDFTRVLQMRTFYGNVLSQIIREFRPKHDFYYLLMRGTFGKDFFNLTDHGHQYIYHDLRYTVSKNPADLFDYFSAKDIMYDENPDLYSWAHIDTNVMNIVDAVTVSSSTGGILYQTPVS